MLVVIEDKQKINDNYTIYPYPKLETNVRRLTIRMTNLSSELVAHSHTIHAFMFISKWPVPEAIVQFK